MDVRRCGVPSCTRDIPPWRAFCAEDWKRIPYRMQQDVWRHYVKGQTALSASKEYKAAYLAAREYAMKVRKEEEAARVYRRGKP